MSLFSAAELPEILDGGAPWPILMERGEIINLKQAEHRSGLSPKTLRMLCKKYAIARQTCRGAPMQISAPALEMILAGDTVALELLRNGDRDHPRVARVLKHLGLLA